MQRLWKPHGCSNAPFIDIDNLPANWTELDSQLSDIKEV